MKVALALLATVCAVAAVPLLNEMEELLVKERALYPRFIEFPDPEGNLHVVDLEAPIDLPAIGSRSGDENGYWLFTRKNSVDPQYLNRDTHHVRNSNFDARKPTVFIIHGWLGTGKADPNPTLRDAFLEVSDVNVITVCWGHTAATLNYVSAALSVPSVGQKVGEYINWLHENLGLRYQDVHIIGFSLGAHLAGNAGRATNGKVARVTGLDPAGPLWNLNSDKLKSTDAVYVEAIHTDGGYTVGGLGIGSSIAQVDWYPNGGVSQPGCLTNVCNHQRAWEFFTATVKYDHLVGRRCSNFLQMTLNTCRSDVLAMGNGDLTKTGRVGDYRVNTNRRYPY